MNRKRNVFIGLITCALLITTVLKLPVCVRALIIRPKGHKINSNAYEICLDGAPGFR